MVIGTAPARAEDRAPAFHVGALALMEDNGALDIEQTELVVSRGVRLTLGWEEPPLPYPAQRGYRVGGALVPELIAGAMFLDDRAEGLIGAGLRGELRIAQREGGWFRINAKSALYLAARGMVVGADRDVLLEGAFGDYVSFGGALRFGFEVGVTDRQRDGMDDRVGMSVQLYLGHGPR